MKIFEKKLLADRFYEDTLKTTREVSKRTTSRFKPPGSSSIQVDSSVDAKIAQVTKDSNEVQRKMKANINRVDLLTDARIGDIKGLMKEIAEQVIKLNKRLIITESEAMRREFDQVPADVLALTKTELQLRHELAQMIGEARETKDWLGKEFKRLRREHYGNLQDIRQILLSFDQISSRV